MREQQSRALPIRRETAEAHRAKTVAAVLCRPSLFRMLQVFRQSQAQFAHEAQMSANLMQKSTRMALLAPRKGQ